MVDFPHQTPVAAAEAAEAANPPPDSVHLQQQREWREEQNARHKAINVRNQLKQYRRESVTEYGAALFRDHADAVAREIESVLYRWLENPKLGGQGYAALPLVAVLHSPQHAAAVALVTVLDRLTSGGSLQGVALSIGQAVEAEIRAGELRKVSPAALERLLQRSKAGRRKAVLKMAERPIEGGAELWTRRERAMVGMLLLEIIRAETGLVVIDKSAVPGKRDRWRLRPSTKALEFVRNHPARGWRPTREPMVVEPVPWVALIGGGHLGNTVPLMHKHSTSTTHEGIAYLSGKVELQMQVVNHLQAQRLEVNPWMLETQRVAWENNVAGLFPVQREPVPDAGPFPYDEWPELQDQWRKAQARHHQDLRDNSHKRMQVERCLQAAESVVGAPIWQAHFLDFRGRMFTTNRTLTHQGPDHQKALLQFGMAPPAGEEGADWMLKAAAGHWGLTRSTWAERLRWGQDNIQRMMAVATDPLGNAHLWREAKQPWQFLQLARGITRYLAHPYERCGVPIRLDQTCSGCGIIATLLQDRATAISCNVTGQGPADLYTVVADRVRHLLELDLHTGTPAEALLAGKWLELGIDRSWTKGPTMFSPFGATPRGIIDGIQQKLEAKLQGLAFREWKATVYQPAHYLEKKLRQALAEEIASTMALRKWLGSVGRLVVGKHQKQIEWLSPMGWPMQLGSKTTSKSSIPTILLGRLAAVTFEDEPPEGELSVRRTNPGLTANLVHSFDAALAHAISCRAAEQGQRLLTNHDCFATTPAAAEWLHGSLHHEYRALYSVDWLTEIAEQIRCNAGLKELPPPPVVGDLMAGELGTSPYLFS